MVRVGNKADCKFDGFLATAQPPLVQSQGAECRAARYSVKSVDFTGTRETERWLRRNVISRPIIAMTAEK